MKVFIENPQLHHVGLKKLGANQFCKGIIGLAVDGPGFQVCFCDGIKLEGGWD